MRVCARRGRVPGIGTAAGPLGGAEEVVDCGMETAVVYMGIVTRSLEERAVEDDHMGDGALFVAAALAYNVGGARRSPS